MFPVSLAYPTRIFISDAPSKPVRTQTPQVLGRTGESREKDAERKGGVVREKNYDSTGSLADTARSCKGREKYKRGTAGTQTAEGGRKVGTAG